MLAEPSSFDTRVFVDEPEEYSKERKKHSESNGEDNSKNDGELSPQSLDMKHGYDPYNQMLSYYQEKFSIKVCSNDTSGN